MFGLKSVGSGIRAFSTSSAQLEKMTVYQRLPAKRAGQSLMAYIHDSQYERLDRNKQKRTQFDRKNPERFRADDVVTVVYKDQKPVSGQIIAVKRQGISSNIQIRSKVEGVGVDMHIPVFHPNITRVDITRRPVKYRPRNKHYYIRNSRLDVS